MKKQSSTALLIMGCIVMLSGCTPVVPLTTPQARDRAVHEELDQIVAAVAARDAAEIVPPQCKNTWIIDMPTARWASADALRAEHIEPLRLEGANYDEPDPDARFFTSSITGAEVDVVVRVDAKEACLWAMGPPFVLLAGL